MSDHKDIKTARSTAAGRETDEGERDNENLDKSGQKRAGRPRIVTFIGGALIFLGLFKTINYMIVFFSSSGADFFSAFVTLSDHPVRALVLSFVGTGILLLGGFFILKGRNAARYAVVAWMAAVLVMNGVSGVAWPLLAIRAAVWGLIVVALFYPAANRYFKARHPAS